jgi:Holliday junction resolvase RusA-like endonuclease
VSVQIQFFVPGIPAPGGSKKAFVVAGRARIVEDSKRNADWRASVALAASREIEAPLEGPLELTLTFVMPRTKGHYGSGKNAGKLKTSAPIWHTTKPDRTKLMRSTEDALTGIAWRDDTQVVSGSTLKQYGDRPGCWISIRAALEMG